jgi:hypothetical protein
MLHLRSFLLTVCLLFATGWHATGHAQSTSPLPSHPGYVDVEQVESWFGAPASIQVDLQGSLLDLVAQSSRSEGDLSAMIDGLAAIQVRGFSMSEANPEEITRRTEDFAQRLENTGWRRVLYVRDGAEVARVFLRPDPDSDGDRIAGLTVLAVDPSDEAVLINVVGPISPDQLQRLGSSLHIESLRDIKTQPEQ